MRPDLQSRLRGPSKTASFLFGLTPQFFYAAQQLGGVRLSHLEGPCAPRSSLNKIPALRVPPTASPIRWPAALYKSPPQAQSVPQGQNKPGLRHRSFDSLAFAAARGSALIAARALGSATLSSSRTSEPPNTTAPAPTLRPPCLPLAVLLLAARWWQLPPSSPGGPALGGHPAACIGWRVVLRDTRCCPGMVLEAPPRSKASLASQTPEGSPRSVLPGIPRPFARPQLQTCLSVTPLPLVVGRRS